MTSSAAPAYDVSKRWPAAAPFSEQRNALDNARYGGRSDAPATQKPQNKAIIDNKLRNPMLNQQRVLSDLYR